MRTRFQFTYLAPVFALAIYLAPHSVALAAEPILVNGVVSEQFVYGNPSQTPHGDVVQAEDEWSGTLVGDGVVHIFSSDFVPPDTSLSVASERKLFTTDGNLFFSEVGDRYGSLVEVVSEVNGGTGIYKGATGTLTFTGTLGGGKTEFVYSGVINLAD
ncbi:MAG: hypothetical protein ACM3QY_05025 [Candidatus Levyibacteriota bacterium]